MMRGERAALVPVGENTVRCTKWIQLALVVKIHEEKLVKHTCETVAHRRPVESTGGQRVVHTREIQLTNSYREKFYC